MPKNLWQGIKKQQTSLSNRLELRTAERDRLKALNAELVKAWDGLTIITRHDDGRIVLGPVGWEQACAAFTKARE